MIAKENTSPNKWLERYAGQLGDWQAYRDAHFTSLGKGVQAMDLRTCPKCYKLMTSDISICPKCGWHLDDLIEEHVAEAKPTALSSRDDPSQQVRDTESKALLASAHQATIQEHPDYEKLVSDLQNKDVSNRQRIKAAQKLGEWDISNEQIVNTLEQVATTDSNKYVAQAAYDALSAPVHQEMLEQLGRQSVTPVIISASSNKVGSNPQAIFELQERLRLPSTRIYKPSGKYSPRSLALMVSFGPLAGAVTGVVAYYIALRTPLLWNWILSLFIGVAGKSSGVIFGAPIIALAYPLLVGVSIGYVTGLLAKWSKCRHPDWVRRTGFLNAIVGYGAFVLLAIQISGTIHLISGAFEATFQQTGVPWWGYGLVGLDASIIIVTAIILSARSVESTPFCEDCGQWYGSWQQGIYSANLNSAGVLIKTLEAGSPQGLEYLTRASATDYPHLIIKMRKCPFCNTSDFQLAVNLAWQIEKTVEGKTQIQNLSTENFRTMIPAGLGTEIERILFSQGYEWAYR